MIRSGFFWGITVIAARCYLLNLFAVFFTLCLLLMTPKSAQGKSVQFQTNVGNFRVILNPTNNSNLLQYVENFLAYVESGRYDNTIIHRADELLGNPSPGEFVVQWGSFVADITKTDQLGRDGFSEIETFDPLIIDADNDGEVDFDTSGLTNSVGTVAFALTSNINSATSSIYVNLSNNTFLDSVGYVPFAVIEDLTVINTVANLPTEDFRALVEEGRFNLSYSDVPIVGQDNFVIVSRAIVIPEPGTTILLIFATLCFAIFDRREKVVERIH